MFYFLKSNFTICATQTHLKLRSSYLHLSSAETTNTHTSFLYINKLAITTLVIIKWGSPAWFSNKFAKPTDRWAEKLKPLNTTSHWVTQRTEPYTQGFWTSSDFPQKTLMSFQTIESMSAFPWPVLSLSQCQLSGCFQHRHPKSGAPRTRPNYLTAMGYYLKH